MKTKKTTILNGQKEDIKEDKNMERKLENRWEFMNRKVLAYQELCALDDVLTENTDDDVRIGYHVCEDNTVTWKVTWSCKGAVKPAEALEFAKALTWCAEKADALNKRGYSVDFSRWIKSRSEYDRFKRHARELVDSL